MKNRELAQAILVMFHEKVQEYYGELLFNVGEEDDEEFEEGLIGGLIEELEESIIELLGGE
jgi:hypothetical protein